MRRYLTWLVWGLMALGCVSLGWVAAHLAVDYWDGFDYLKNARLIAGHRPPHLNPDFSYARPPLVSLLTAPLLLAYAPAGGGTAVAGPHLVSMALAAAGLFGTYRLMRECFGPLESAVSALLVLLNPLFIHYAPFVMMDVPSMTFTALTLWAYLAARRTGRPLLFALAGLCAGATVCTKYPAALLVPTLGLVEVARVLRPGPRAAWLRPSLARRASSLLDVRLLLALAVAGAFTYGVHGLAFRLASFGGGDTWHWMQAAMDWGFGHNTTGFQTDPWWEYGAELWTLLTPPLCILGLVGVVEACRRWTASDVAHLAWALVFLGMMTFRVGHKEARYLMPVLPSLAFLTVRGFQWVKVPWRWAVAGLLLVWPAYGAWAEARRFADPVYAHPILPQLAAWALERAGPSARFVLEGYFTEYPDDPVSLPLDEYGHFHTLNYSTFEYYLDHGVEETQAPADPSLATARAFPHGGALIHSPVGTYDASHRPPPGSPAPLVVTRIEHQTGAQPPAGSGWKRVSDVDWVRTETRAFRFR